MFCDYGCHGEREAFNEMKRLTEGNIGVHMVKEGAMVDGIIIRCMKIFSDFSLNCTPCEKISFQLFLKMSKNREVNYK